MQPKVMLGDPWNGRKNAIIEYSVPEAAQRAIQEANGLRLGNYEVIVHPARYTEVQAALRGIF